MVFQDPYGSLHPRQTVDRALSEPLLVHGFGRHRAAHLARAGRGRAAVVGALPLPAPTVRRAAPARRDRPRADGRARGLLLDEPTSALDVSVQAEVLNLLADLQQRRGLTYMMVSHNLAVVAHLCEKVGVMQGGELVETLSADDLRAGRIKHPHTAALRELSVELEEPEGVVP